MALTDNLVAYYKLDEASGNAADSSGNSLTMTNNGPTYSNTNPLINNYALFDDASAQYFEAADNDLWTPSGSQSWQFWVKPDTTTAGEYFLISKDLNTSRGYRIEYQPNYTNNEITWGFSWDANASPNYTFNAGQLSTSSWTHLVLVYNSTAHTADVYVNGTAVTQVTGLPTDTQKNNTETLYIGANHYSTRDRYWSGRMDEIAMWSRAITSTEVTALYNSGAGLQYPFSTSAIKTVNSLAKASVKSVNGLAIASVKSWGGLA
jgi:hypothetical protein